jgi:hypothetical protein
MGEIKKFGKYALCFMEYGRHFIYAGDEDNKI